MEQSAFPDPVRMYHDKIRDYARWSQAGSPWVGESLQRLHTFISSETESGPVQGFVWLYRFEKGTRMPPRELTDPLELDGYEDSSSSNSSNSSGSNLLILRGYPSARWIVHLGARYQIDPRFWLTHAPFLSDAPNRVFENSSLPSSYASIVQFPLLSLGSHRIPRGQVSQHLIDQARQRSADAMVEYRHNLITGKLWSSCASIVRNHWVLGEENFCIEQLVSVALLPRKDAANSWTMLMWFDIGNDLSMSPPGPWARDIASSPLDIRRYFHALPHLKSDVILQPEKYMVPHDVADDGAPNPWLSSHSLSQGLLGLPVDYGRSLADMDGPFDAFMVLSELLCFVAASQLQCLRQLELRIAECASESDEIESKGAVSQQTNLVFYRRLLQEQAQKCAHMRNFVRDRKLLGWEKQRDGQDDDSGPHSAALELDFGYLADLSTELRDRCDREMTVLINAANIAEVQRNIRHGKTVFKLTLLAAVYVPVSFVTSFFGMNLTELGSDGSPRIWIWAVVTVLLSGTSFAFIFLNRETLALFWRFFARAATL